MKMAGLGHLRWYCTPCEKTVPRSERLQTTHAFRAHVRRMESITDVNKTINDYSNQFQTAFLDLLRTSHREKAVQSNQSYQTYIAR